jgi:hypothetical protein
VVATHYRCSRYYFESDGLARRRSPERRPGSFAEAYKGDVRIIQWIGTLTNHLNGTPERATEAIGQCGLVITQFDYIEMLSYRRDALHNCLSNFM